MRTPNFRDYCVDKYIKDRHDNNVSIYRGSRQVLVYQNFKAHPEIHYRTTSEHKVGGVLGFGQSQSETEITFKQN
jgi:hypothetical protein